MIRSDSDDGDGDSADGGDALDQEDDEFSMLTAAATESLEHVRRFCFVLVLCCLRILCVC